MVKCAAPNCRTGFNLKQADRVVLKKGGSVARRSVFTFPKNPERRARWLSALRRSDTGWSPDNCGVCELHFSEDDFFKDPRRKNERRRKFLNRDAVPSVFNYYPQ